MDDLMRRAAEDYPVKPQGMDWEKVAQQLDTTDKEAPANRYGGLKKLLLLLPFILTSFVCDRFLAYEYGHLKKLDVATKTNQPGNQTSAATVTTNKVITSKELLNELPAMNVNPVVMFSQKQYNNERHLKNTLPSIPIRGRANQNSLDEAQRPTSYEQANLLLTTAVQPNLLNGMAAPTNKNVWQIAIDQKPSVSQKKDVQKAEFEKAYVSLLMGPDYSRVKSQEVKPAGYSVGAVAGYRFSKRWAVEAGLLWDRKNYFSKGDFFKTDKIQLPEHTKVTQVDGYCAMFEIPVNVRYTAWQGHRDAVTLSAGSSSYLMHNEDYDYVAQRYGVWYKGNTSYKHASKNWFSVANLSLGYEHQLGQKLKIHIEPYLKIPVTGVGIGSLPLSSKGVLVGVTYPIH